MLQINYISGATGRRQTVPLSKLTLDVLAATMHLQEHGVHGYRLSSELGASHGSVYTTLSRLLDAGLVEVEEEDGAAAEEARRQPRRIFRITQKG